MSLKDSLRGALELAHEALADRLDGLYATADILLDEYLPDGADVDIQAKADALADYYEATGGDAEAVVNYRSGDVPAPIVHVLYAALVKFKPEAAVKDEVNSSQWGPAQYLNYLRENFPTMAKVYEQTLLNQERENNAGHKAETEEG